MLIDIIKYMDQSLSRVNKRFWLQMQISMLFDGNILLGVAGKKLY